MQQLDFWPATHKAPYAQKLWEALPLEDQDKVNAALARLIVKAVCPALIGEDKEQSHEH